jgi:hypothetical protein
LREKLNPVHSEKESIGVKTSSFLPGILGTPGWRETSDTEICIILDSVEN